MKKRILSFFIIFTILICNFAVVAFADISSLPFDFILSFYASSMYDYNSVASDPDALIDFYDTDRGKLELLPFIPLTSAVGYCVARNSLEEASEGRYLVAQMSRDHLQAIYDSFNDYWASDSAPVRNGNLEDYHLTLSNGSTLHSGFGTLAGSGPAMLNGDPWNSIERSHCISFCPSGSLSSGNGDVYIYNGSLYFPPVIFVTTYGSVLHNNQSLDTGIYIVLNSTQLLLVDNSYFNYKWCLFYGIGNDSHVGSIRRFVYNDSDYSTSQLVYKIVNNGSVVSFDEYCYTPDFSYDDVLDLISKSIGNHIVFGGEQVQPISFTIGDDVPFEDDDVVVMVPVDEPGEPVFMSPTTYNTYIDNGDIYNTDNTTNNIINDNSVTNFMNIYNDYITNNNSSSSGYDDTNLMTKLDTIINKLSDIYNAIVNFSFADVDPCYENFSDCFFNHFTMLSMARDILEQIDAGVPPDNVQLASSDGKTPEASGASAGDSSSDVDFYSGVSVGSILGDQTLNLDFSWYKPYREDIHLVLKFLAYAMGFIACNGSLKSICGILHYNMSDHDYEFLIVKHI